ncbi:unnamed protein product [Rotaria sp. Silwood2]|nr:unnamed protein product [Rotaria sp. Silwood2]
MNKSIEFTTTNRNAPVLHYQGYQYTIKRNYKTTSEWRCRRRPCTASLSLSLGKDSIIREPGDHTCQYSSPESVVVEKAICRMKKRATEETLPIPHIYAQEIIKIRIDHPQMNTGAAFPLLNSIDSTLYRRRAQNYPKLPSSIIGLMIPDPWKLDRYGEPFLLIDETYGEDRLLMFASDWSLKFLGMMIPCVYCLSTKQDENIYMKILHNLLRIVQQKGIHFVPERITCDYELAAINAFRSVFPQVHISGCFFHFSQSLWRKIQELGLTQYVKYANLTASNNASAEEKMKSTKWFLCAIGLALIPPHLVEKTWAEVMDEYTPSHRSAIKFNDYMVSTYVDLSSCRFPVNLWNVNDAVINNIPRTNNHVEGFIELLKDEHLFQHHHAEQSRTYLPRRQKLSENINAQLIRLLNKHSNREITDLELALQCGKAVKTKLAKK